MDGRGPGIEVLVDLSRREICARLALRPYRPSVLASELGKARSTISHHLRVLEEAGLIRMLPFATDERSYLYALEPRATGRVIAWLAGTDIARRLDPAPAEDTVDTEDTELTAHSQEPLRSEASNVPMAAQSPGVSVTGAHVLVVDDEPAITDLLSTALRYMGYQVTTAATGNAALEAAATASPDLVVLDVMLPDLDGFEVCRRLREQRDFVPVIFLSARDSEDDRVTGFVRGGDDYVTKPFSLEELTLRIGALLRRVRGGAEDGAARLRYRDLEMDEDRHQVWRAGREVELSPTEFRLLRYFLLNPERVLSKQQILDHVWQYDFNGEDNVVETYVSYLRRKLDDGEPRLVRTVRGFGYVLRAE
ncbi:MAG TPA: response regulator [Candidatus Limnocylindrales bacterium]|jgi:two-component system OmpR family response regulator